MYGFLEIGASLINSISRLCLCFAIVAVGISGPASVATVSAAIALPPLIFINSTPVAPADRVSNTGAPGLPSNYPSVIPVSGVSGVVTEAKVTLTNISHSFPVDLDVLLVGPTGARSILISDGIDTQQLNLRTFTFSQSASIALPQSGGALSGTYRPANYAGDPIIEPGGVDEFPSPGPGVSSYTADLGVFAGTNPNGNWNLYVVDDENIDQGSIAGGWSLELTVAVPLAPVVNDFDGDHRSDVSVFRPSAGAWYILRSSNNSFLGVQWGANGDIPIAGDFDGDGRSDLSVWRAAGAGQPGAFLILRSSDSTFVARQWGVGGDDPSASRDYDGDGKTDFAVYRPGSASSFFVLRSSDSVFFATQWGTSADVPVPADYDGDGKADVAVYSVTRPAGNSTFYLLFSSNGQFQATQFGAGATDRVVTGDFDGDHKADLAVWRTAGPNAGSWYYYRSSDGAFRAVGFGAGATDTPTPADYDGDGITDIAVYRPGAASAFYQLTSSNAAFVAIPWGTTGDVPTTNYLVH